MVVHERELVNNLELNIWYKDFATDNELMLIAQFIVIDVIVITFSIEFMWRHLCFGYSVNKIKYRKRFENFIEYSNEEISISNLIYINKLHIQTFVHKCELLNPFIFY